MKRIYIFMMVMLLVLGISVSGHAALIDMGDGTIYDNDTQLSWLKDANANGQMTWFDANTWANGLDFAGFTDWRLPTTLQPDSSCSYQYDPGGSMPLQGLGSNCTGSEMGHLYYTELGNQAGAPFTNMQEFYYWSGTEYAPDTSQAWYFSFYNGGQIVYPKNANFYALAVRPGERTTSVPEPATLLLFGSGLAGIVVWRKRLG